LHCGLRPDSGWRGETSFTIRNPWVVACAFGLLHGFGFVALILALERGFRFLPGTYLKYARRDLNVGGIIHSSRQRSRLEWLS
jgi:hypothetical protein